MHFYQQYRSHFPPFSSIFFLEKTIRTISQQSHRFEDSSQKKPVKENIRFTLKLVKECFKRGILKPKKE